MSPGPGSDREGTNEQTFADLLAGFTLDSGRGRRREREQPPPEAPAEQSGRREVGHGHADPASGGSAQPPGYPPARRDAGHGQPRRGLAPPQDPSAPYQHPAQQPSGYEQEPEYDEEDAAAIVRAYAWTRGRTKSDYHLEIETLVSTSERGYNGAALTQAEHRSVASLCAQPRSVAEVAALLSLPLGVARVLLGDMAGLGLINVHQTASVDGDKPDLALMERVLSGLRRL